MAADSSTLRHKLIRTVFRGQWMVGILLLVLLGLRLADPPLVEKLRFLQFDLFQQLAPREGVAPPVVIINIDEESLRKIGQWPWPRTVLAELVDRLTAAGIVATGFDVTFPEPDRTSPQWLVSALGNGLSKTTQAELLQQPSNDTQFAASMRRSRVVLGITGASQRTDGPDKPAATPLARIGGDPCRFALKFPGTVSNLAELDAAAAGRGAFSLEPEWDGVVRRVPALICVGEQVYPALIIELLRVALGEPSFSVRSTATNIDSMIVGRNRIPTDPNGNFWVHYQPHDPAIYVSAWQVLDGSAPREKLAGRIALVGASAAGLGDISATPLGTVPGVEIHWQMLGSILANDYLTRPIYADMAELAAIVVIGLLIIVVMMWLRARWTALLLLGVLAALAGSTWYAYRVHGLLFDAIYPGIATILFYTAQVYVNHYTSERQRRQVSEAFGRYVSPVLVQRLSKEPARLQLGGETKDMTILFCDIRGFTRISERLKGNPQALTHLINRFLTPLSEEVMRYSGTIDKYIGDCLMAFWNAPLDDPQHARHACAAALDMFQALEKLNLELAQEATATVVVDESARIYRRLKELTEDSAAADDRAQAVMTLRVNASDGNAYSQYVLGKAYRDGLVGQRNLDEAMRWFSAAAKQGYTPAQRNLGARMARGDGVAADDILALYWLTLAARDGLAAAEEVRIELMQRMSVADIAAAERRARAWRPIGMRQGVMTINMGIGINTGECVVGNMGSRLRFDYSVLGDPVNVASRLEAQSSNYGIGIVISEATYAQAPDFAALEVDRIIVKGKSEPLRIYGLIGTPELAQSEEFKKLSWHHQAMLQAYRERQWDEALEHVEFCARFWPTLEPLYDLYRDRVENFKATAPSADWDGVFVALKK